MSDRTDAELIFENAAASALYGHFDPDKRGQFATLPQDWHIQRLEYLQSAPNRIEANHSFVETASLAAYVNLFRTPDTMITANYAEGVIRAVIDGDSPTEPAFKCHTSEYRADIHDTLKAWLEIEGRAKSQVEFGLFLEDRATDVVRPDAATIMEMVMQFEATKKVEFKSSMRLHDGARQLQYVEDSEARGAITLPDHIVVRCPIYRGLDPQDIKFMLRFRIEDGKLRFQVDMHNKREVMRTAFDRCVDAFRLSLKDEATIFVTG